MGVVYEAWDRQRGARVALKTLIALDPQGLYLFKNEFRFLVDVSHPNLAALYELFSEEGQWFFTMQYVEGGHFLEYVRDDYQALGPDASTFTLGGGPPVEVSQAAAGRVTGRCNMDRLRESLGQLARGVAALHAAGIVHRDLKPSNIKVTPEGRVAVLDFGLAALTDGARFGELPAQAGPAGTVAYMSPEQAAGERVTEAADWYAVGVIVYEALTGRRPFEGSARRVLQDKVSLDALRVSVAADVSEEWEAICAGLLAREPGRRWTGSDLLDRLERKVTPVPAGAGRSADRIFVGRETYFALLLEAFAASEGNVPSLVFVHGKSGIGKTSLIEHFLRQLAADSSAVILAGRCYERESVPYKAFDSVVDSLARYMAALPRPEAGELIPRDAAALAQVFPVLRQVEAIASAPQRQAQILDQHELRRKAFGALRELFGRLGDRRRLVIYIDDLQWGDLDSATLLREVLRPPDAPAFLFVGAYRSEYAGRSAPLNRLLTITHDNPGLERRDILIGPLSREETRSLAARLLSEQGHDVPDPNGRLEEITRESEGSPYLVQEIVAGSEFDPEEAGVAAGVTLDSVLHRRIAVLPDEPRRLLETVAVSVRPLGEREAFQAARIGTQELRALGALRAGRLIRGAGASGEIEPYHDRVRETVLAHLDPAVRVQCHFRLATTLEALMEAGGRADSEAVAVHFEGAGEKAKASHYYAAAAERASAALAFKHAAELCQRALDLSPLTGEDRRGLVVKLADALGNTGHGLEAALAYREAGRGAREPEVFALERKEAYWLASSGHVDEGREALLKTLRRVKARVPGPLGRLAGIVFAELQLRIRGIEFRERTEGEIPRALLDRIDVHWDAARSFGMIDATAAMYLTGRCLLLALRAGETSRIARALALQSMVSAALQTPTGRSQGSKLIQVCTALTDQTKVPYLRGFTPMAKGMVAFFRGGWLESLRHFEDAERILSRECTGVAWELASGHIFSLWDLLYSGKYAELRRRTPILSQEGAARGDLYQAVTIGLGPQPFCEMIAGHPSSALHMLDEWLNRWSHRSYNVQLATAVILRSWIYLYQGDAAAAWDLLNREWPILRRNHYLRVSGARQWLYFGRAQSALALAGTAADPGGALLRSAERDARKLEGDEACYGHALGRLIRAGCASRRGETQNSIALLEEAVAELDAADMAMMAAAARGRLGEALCDERGRGMIEESESAMKAEGVEQPANLAAVFANGFGPRGNPNNADRGISE